MSKSLKFKNNMYLDSSSIVHGRELLSNLIVGLGGSCKNVSGDWNTACGNRTGFYRGSGLKNAPPNIITVAGWVYMIHLVHDSSYKRQLAFSFSNNAPTVYMRSQENGTWSEWRYITFSNKA